jgi:hypothetical protein
MTGFGRSGGGGRRHADRHSAPLEVSFETLTRKAVADLVDLSRTGVRIRGPGLCKAGEELLIRIEGLRAFGTVLWTEGDECGVEFDVPLGPTCLGRIYAGALACRGQAPAARTALEHWNSGYAR